MKSSHIASFGLRGMTGARIGTRYLYSFEEVRENVPLPWFRWRNEETRQKYLAWLAEMRSAA